MLVGRVIVKLVLFIPFIMMHSNDAYESFFRVESFKAVEEIKPPETREQAEEFKRRKQVSQEEATKAYEHQEALRKKYNIGQWSMSEEVAKSAFTSDEFKQWQQAAKKIEIAQIAQQVYQGTINLLPKSYEQMLPRQSATTFNAPYENLKNILKMTDENNQELFATQKSRWNATFDNHKQSFIKNMREQIGGVIEEIKDIADQQERSQIINRHQEALLHMKDILRQRIDELVATQEREIFIETPQERYARTKIEQEFYRLEQSIDEQLKILQTYRLRPSEKRIASIKKLIAAIKSFFNRFSGSQKYVSNAVVFQEQVNTIKTVSDFIYDHAQLQKSIEQDVQHMQTLRVTDQATFQDLRRNIDAYALYLQDWLQHVSPSDIAFLNDVYQQLKSMVQRIKANLQESQNINQDTFTLIQSLDAIEQQLSVPLALYNVKNLETQLNVARNALEKQQSLSSQDPPP